MSQQQLGAGSMVLFITVFTIFVMLSVSAAAANLNATGSKCGGTVADCMETGGGPADGGEEFLMDSETSSKFLAQMSATKHITPSVLKKDYVPCNNQLRYGNCLGLRHNPKPKCDYHNRSCR
nr:Rapid ALkalinization Factor [Ipomoea batatas]